MGKIVILNVMKPALLLTSLAPLVSGHGSMVWPPIWQDGAGFSIEAMTSELIFSDPLVKDPATGKVIKSPKTWLTDQAYLGGHGDEHEGREGNVTNRCYQQCYDKCGGSCANRKVPWSAPGVAESLGGGCGVFGGNPYGCPAGNDTRAPGSTCGQYKKKRGTFAFGSSALDVDFPQAITTEWEIGSNQDVASFTYGGHGGGYTYRLCKLPAEGKKGITEDCFAQNVLEFVTPYTMIRDLKSPGSWFKVDQNDLTEGTYPEGSAWRNIAYSTRKIEPLRKDTVKVPTHLPEGDYVLSWRWDTKAPQIWVSCSNVKLVMPK